MLHPRIVLIDDSESDILLFRMCLDAMVPGHELTVLKDGEEALTFVEAERGKIRPTPCAIVLDIHLPKHDGFEILEAIRRVPVLNHVKALLVSTSLSAAHQKRLEELDVPFAPRPNSLPKCEAFARRVLEMCKAENDIAARPVPSSVAFL